MKNLVNKLSLLTVLMVFAMIYSACQKDDEDVVSDPFIMDAYDETPYTLDIGPLPPPFLPSDNELTVAKVELGRMLFYEPMLSSDNSQSCASCHNQATAFTDTSRFSIGVEGLPGKRQAMSVFNMAWNTNEFFWDGRAHLLRDQSLMPIQDPLEMNETLENVIDKLSGRNEYLSAFNRAFDSQEINAEKMSLAMEQFMLSITSYGSKWDEYRAGLYELTESEERGRVLYFTEYNPGFPETSGADCAHCHGGPNFENDRYMNNGLDREEDFADLGRYEVSGDDRDKAAFKVPSLRNIELTPPYMHDGRFQTLEEVIDHYNDGIQLSMSLDPALRATTQTGLQLTDQDKADLVAFLKILTDPSLATNEAYSDPF